MDDALYPYQVEGADILASRDRMLIADEPGLGKSAQLVVAADLIRASTILIIPPASVRFVWKQQLLKWSMFGHDINVVTSGDARPIKNAVNVINYDLLGRGFTGKVGYVPSAFLKAWAAVGWDLVICDEAHYLKEQNSLRTNAILGNVGIGNRAKRLWLATGTPMPNHPGELWVMLVSLGATNLEYKEFIYKYCLLAKGGFNKGQPYAANPATADELNKVMKSVMIRRYKKFVLPQLPKLRVDELPVPEVKIKLEEFFEDAIANPKNVANKIREQEAFVRQIWQAAIASEGEMNTMEMVNVLENLGSGVALYRRWLGAVKAASLVDIISDELETGATKKIVLGCWHRQVINFLKVRLEKYGVLVIDGGTSMNARESVVNDFRYKDKRVLIGQIIAMGTGVDGLQHAAHRSIIVEPAWSPHLNAQFIMRLHRIGQKWPVDARMARLADTLDDYISEVLTRKTKDIVRVLGD